MRVIKYRVWDGVDNKMLYDVETEMVPISNGKETILRFQKDSYMGEEIVFLEGMEWTGLVDKNGKDIYEGDIVKVNHPMGEEFYGEVFFRYDGCFAHTFLEGRPSKRMWKYCEVVGNMFENPEMME